MFPPTLLARAWREWPTFPVVILLETKLVFSAWIEKYFYKVTWNVFKWNYLEHILQCRYTSKLNIGNSAVDLPVYWPYHKSASWSSTNFDNKSHTRYSKRFVLKQLPLEFFFLRTWLHPSLHSLTSSNYYRAHSLYPLFFFTVVNNCE